MLKGIAMLTEDRFRFPVESVGLDWDGNFNSMLARDILNYLHSQGVGIKVKCPDCSWSEFKDEESAGMTPCYNCDSTGYITEPLIEDVQHS